MKNYILFFYVAILSGNPILWYSEVINEYQLEPATAQKLELRWVATGNNDTSFNYPFDIIGARIITPAGTAYVDTSIIIYDSSRIVIDSSMVQGDFSLVLDSGFIDISHK